jgi:transcriptional regulator with XRE-family HTH domain
MIDLQLEKKIKELSKKNSLSIRQLCLKIEMTESGLSKAFDNNTLKIETLQKIADVFAVPISYFFVDETNSNEAFELLKKENELLKNSLNAVTEGLKDKDTISIMYSNHTDMLFSAISSILLDIYNIGRNNDIDLEAMIEKTFGYKTLVNFLNFFEKELSQTNQIREKMIIHKKKYDILYEKKDENQ